MKNQILIVDDNLKNLQLTAKILKDEGYLISLAMDGQSTLSMLNQNIPDLILLDIMMPGIDGLDVCRRIKFDIRLKEIPIIFLTAKNQLEDLQEGFNSGGVDYITKPFRKDELLVRVRTHLELSNARKKIMEMNLTRNKLYSIIAHDIRSPFSGIAQTIDALSNNYLDPESNLFKDILVSLKQKTNETISLLNNLLEWTKLHSESISLSPKTTNLSLLIFECTHLFKGSAANKNIKIEQNIPENAEGFFDEVTIHTAIRNIFSNAIKFTPENGIIKIDFEYSEQFASLHIRDSGVGISKAILHKIFDKNEHYTSRGTNNEQGSGLGLYIVKDFVEKNCGTVSIDSNVGQGTVVTINLPRSYR
jgi:two-component system sensor histidine kinase/response regulator